MTIIAEINRSCTPEQAKSFRKVLEDQGWIEGVDFIDHTKSGTDCCSKEEMAAFRRSLGAKPLPNPMPPLRRLQGVDEVTGRENRIRDFVEGEE